MPASTDRSRPGGLILTGGALLPAKGYRHPRATHWAGYLPRLVFRKPQPFGNDDILLPQSANVQHQRDEQRRCTSASHTRQRDFSWQLPSEPRNVVYGKSGRTFMGQPGRVCCFEISGRQWHGCDTSSRIRLADRCETFDRATPLN